MNMDQQKLEILIGKYLDSEITPAEQRLLEVELRNNPQVKERLEQLQDLHERTREVLAGEFLEQGNTPDEIFERAWQQATKHPLRLRPKAGGYVQFAAGLAAGLVLGLALDFFLTLDSSRRRGNIEPKPIAQATDNYVDVYSQPLLVGAPNDTENMIRNVEWYGFTDKNGIRWLVQGVRENKIRAAVHEEGL